MQFEISEVANKSQKDRFLLTRALAFERSKYITDVAYQLFFYFQASSDSYKVETTINFTLLTLKDVIIECGASLIHEIAINNKALSLVSIDEIWEENALTFPQGYLIEGRNTIKLKTTSIFSRDSSGFHSYIHHTGDNQICYTVCPPNYAHLIYPCFDQPDIKATFELKVSAPSQWLVISNNPVLETKMENMSFVIIGSSSSRKSWIFKKTPRISTYLFAIAAGNFVEIKPSKPTTVPMRLYCSSHKHGYLVTQSEEFFSLIESGIKYYSQFFGTDFPFEKYDQVFCPEFKYLGMENPGMVCITESYIYMTQMSAFKKSQRALTVLHELSHMWFGDLVTMKWWDSIWLNEGFASFISYHTLSVVSKDPFAHTIDVKFIFYKQEALNTDNLDSTHPVEQDVKDTEAATNIFDDITYCKGSAVIKHLMYMIGEENFSKALSSYFKKFAWNNADSVDFFNVIQSVLEEERSEINAMRSFGTSSADSENTLQKWIHDWLETEGKVNVSFEVTSTPEKMLVEIVKENLPRRVTLNKHIDLEFALFYQDYGNKLSRIVSERICLKEEKTTVEIPLNGFSAKDLGVALNYKDYAYADIIMDNLSIEFFLRNIKQVEPLMKAQIFVSMIKKIESGKMNPVPLFEWVAQQLSEDEIPYLTSEYLIYSTKLMDCYLPEKLREKCGRIMFSKLYSILGSYNNTQDRSKEELTVTIQEYITNFAYSNEDMLLLVKWMQKKNSSLNKVNLTGVLMGRIIEEIFLRKLLSQSEIDYMKSVYVKKHPYYLNFTIGAEADIETKMKLWEKFVAFKPSDGSHYEFSCMMKGINNPHDKDIYTLAERFFDDLLRVFESNENEYCNVFFTNLFPKLHNPDFMIERIQGLMDRAHAYANLKNLLEEKLYQAKICGELEKYV